MTAVPMTPNYQKIRQDTSQDPGRKITTSKTMTVLCKGLFMDGRTFPGLPIMAYRMFDCHVSFDLPHP